ncbi:MAG: hypothetical protein V1909_06575 [Candidatus Micrarchaeota archaeon]
MGKERFEKAKKALLEWIGKQLEEKQEVSPNIYEIGCIGKEL